MVYTRGLQPLGRRLVLVHTLLGKGRTAGREQWVSERSFICCCALLPITHITTWTILPPHPILWKNCFPRNWSLVPKRLGITGLQNWHNLDNFIFTCNLQYTLQYYNNHAWCLNRHDNDNLVPFYLYTFKIHIKYK